MYHEFCFAHNFSQKRKVDELHISFPRFYPRIIKVYISLLCDPSYIANIGSFDRSAKHKVWRTSRDAESRSRRSIVQRARNCGCNKHVAQKIQGRKSEVPLRTESGADYNSVFRSLSPTYFQESAMATQGRIPA